MPHHPLYLTSAIPYVNARPHLGHALELVQVDVLARHARQRHRPVRTLAGTDELSLKSVRAAQAAGVPTQVLVDRNAAAFQQLAAPLQVSLSDFIRTSADPRHAPGVQRLWRAWQDAGDLYRRHYEGHYCVDCEQFYDLADVTEGLCPVHHTPLELLSETNWFFRLSRYQGLLTDAVSSGRLAVEPEQRRNEVLALLRGRLADISVSRSASRAHHWGVPVPGDPTQVVYVWIDALANYVTALDVRDPGSGLLARWWTAPDVERVHVIGKGILRFHAVYWPALLASAGLELPSRILVHDYLTVGGRKIAKSDPATAVDVAALVAAYGTDAVRWWLAAEVPRLGDADFTPERLAAVYDRDLAGGVGNLLSRVTTLIHRARDGRIPQPPASTTGWDGDAAEGAEEAAAAAAGELAALRAGTAAIVDACLARYDLRGAAAAVRRLVAAANRYAEAAAPWLLARAERSGDREATPRLDVALATLAGVGVELAGHLTPFLPEAAARIQTAISPQPADPAGRIPPPSPVFPRLHPDLAAAARPPTAHTA